MTGPPIGDQSHLPSESSMTPQIGQSYDNNLPPENFQSTQSNLTLPPIRSLDLAPSHGAAPPVEPSSHAGSSAVQHATVEDGVRAQTPSNRRDNSNWRPAYYSQHAEAGQSQYAQPSAPAQRDAPEQYSRSYHEEPHQHRLSSSNGRDQGYLKSSASSYLPSSSQPHLVAVETSENQQTAIHNARLSSSALRMTSPFQYSQVPQDPAVHDDVSLRSYDAHTTRNDYRPSNQYPSTTQIYPPTNVLSSSNPHALPHQSHHISRPSYGHSGHPASSHTPSPANIAYPDYEGRRGEKDVAVSGTSLPLYPRASPDLYRNNSYDTQPSSSISRGGGSDDRLDRARDFPRPRDVVRSPVVRPNMGQPATSPRAQASTSSRSPYRNIAHMGSSISEIIDHCNALTSFARHYASLQRESRDPQGASPSATELAQMVQRATLVAQLLDGLRLARQSEENPPPSTPAPGGSLKRSWDTFQAEGQTPLRLIFETGQGGRSADSATAHDDLLTTFPASDSNASRYAQAKAAEDLELIKRKRHANSEQQDSETKVVPKVKKRGPRQKPSIPVPGQCTSCGSRDTPEWRRGPDGPRTLCNACGLHYAKIVREGGETIEPEGESDISQPRSHALPGRRGSDSRVDGYIGEGHIVSLGQPPATLDSVASRNNLVAPELHGSTASGQSQSGRNFLPSSGLNPLPYSSGDVKPSR